VADQLQISLHRAALWTLESDSLILVRESSRALIAHVADPKVKGRLEALRRPLLARSGL
jgi:hypothetical protein